MGGRGVIRLRYVHAFRDRSGRMRYYFRRNGKRTPLPGLPGCAEFMGAYAALLSDRPQQVEQRLAAAPRTFAALAIRYYGSPQYRSLSASSRTNYRRVIDRFLEQHGHRRVDQMTREHVDVVIGKMAGKPGAGIILLKRIRTLVRYAIALGWTDRDPTAGVRGYKSTEIHTWNEGEISVFEKRWPEGTRERLTFALLLYTGQRGSDVYRMTWADIVGDTIRVAQQKTAAKLTIPIHDALHRVLAIANRSHATILVTAYGEQFSVKGFGHMISTAIRAAGLPERCKAHGLRKAAARMRLSFASSKTAASNSTPISSREVCVPFALFAGHDQGAENWAAIASLVETCKLHGVDPQAYFADVLTKLVNLWPASRLDELMPWAWAARRSTDRLAA